MGVENEDNKEKRKILSLLIQDISNVNYYFHEINNYILEQYCTYQLIKSKIGTRFFRRNWHNEKRNLYKKSFKNKYKI